MARSVAESDKVMNGLLANVLDLKKTKQDLELKFELYSEERKKKCAKLILDCDQLLTRALMIFLSEMYDRITSNEY